MSDPSERRPWWERLSPRGREAALGVALAAVTVAVYLPALRAGFVWDDHEYLLGDPVLHTTGGLAWIWQGRMMDWLPLTFTAFWAQWQLWGAAPAGYHATNLALHVATALMLWRVLEGLRIPGAWVGAALFALHPVGAASVAWVMELKNVLSAALALAAAWAWLRFDAEGRRRWYWGSLAAFGLSVLAKASVVTLPVALLGACWWRRGRIERRDLLHIAPFFAVAGAAAVVAVVFQANAVAFMAPSPEGTAARLANAGIIAGAYLLKVLAPVHLGMVYPRWTIDPAGVVAWAADAAWLAVLALAFAWRRGWGRPVLAVLVLHLAALLPVLGLFEMSFHRLSLVGDHLAYLAVIGPAAAAGAGLAALAGRTRGRPAAVALFATLAIALGASTRARAVSFEDDESLWRANVASQPGAAAAHELLGNALSAEWRLAESLAELREAARLSPDLPEFRAQLGTSLVWAGRSDEGLAEIREAIRRSPADLRFQLMLGEALSAAARHEEALSVLAALVRDHPGVGEFHRALGVALASAGSTREAIGELEEAVRLDPEDERARSVLAGIGAGTPGP